MVILDIPYNTKTTGGAYNAQPTNPPNLYVNKNTTPKGIQVGGWSTPFRNMLVK